MANQVTLTFAGETKGAEDAFKRVGDSGKQMGDRLKNDGFDKVGEAADDVDTKAMGFRDTLTGIQDTTKGIKDIAAGNWGFESLLTLGAGIGDLGSGMFNFLVPAFKATKTAVMGMNLAFLSSPITWIILGIIALVAVFVLLWNKCDWFRNFWIGLWKLIKGAAQAVGSWFKNTLWPWIRDVWDGIKNKAIAVWEWLKTLPGKIKGAFVKIAGFISAPFRSAFNFIASAWNNTIGRLSWTVPGWVPFIGGNSISVPNLPHFHSGGIVPGVPGSEQLAVLQAGERISPASSSGGGREEWIHIDLGDLGAALLEPIARAVQRRGGSVTALGVRVVNGTVR